MKTLHSHQLQRDASHSRPTSSFPSSAKISDPVETLLVVDVDPMVRDAETQILRLQEYAVVEAQGTAESLRSAREVAAIHFLITA